MYAMGYAMGYTNVSRDNEYIYIYTHAYTDSDGWREYVLMYVQYTLYTVHCTVYNVGLHRRALSLK